MQLPFEMFFNKEIDMFKDIRPSPHFEGVGAIISSQETIITFALPASRDDVRG